MMVGALMAGGCDEATADGSGDVVGAATRPRSLADNGVELNGTRFNGTRFNGTRFNGSWFNGAKLVDARISSGSVKGHLSDWSLVPGTSLLQAKAANGSMLVGADLVGAGLQWLVDDGSGSTIEVRMRITSVTQSAERPDVYFTGIDVRVGGDAWESLCTDGAGAPTEAIVMPGYFDEETASWHPGEHGELAFACRGAAAGKCLEWGYRVWATQGGEPLADHYRACTRMVRADYCGNNVAHTVNGTVIDVSDGLDPAILSPETDWAVEAKWGPNGAVCLNQPRKLEFSRAAVVAECQSAGVGALPTCDDEDPAEHDGLLLSQAEPS